MIADPSLARGDWNERVTLTLPPAAGGTAPEVALVASHRVNQSEVGAGWMLQAGGSIRRRASTGGVPALTSVMASSQFLADGAELVPVTGVGSAHYQPESYDGSRFDYDAATNTWIRRRNGWTWTYGGTGMTRSIVATMPMPFCTAPCNTESWFLASAVDPFGNRIDYTYENATMPTSMSGVYGGTTASRDYHVKTITYGGGTAVVTFTYVARPDITVDLSGGFPVVHHRRLSHIEASAGGQLYSKYVMQYEDESGTSSLLGTLTDCNNANVATSATPTRRSLLRKVFRTSTSTKTLVRCNRYHHQGIGWMPSTDLSSTIADPFTNLEAIEDTWSLVATELDGNGRSDLILLAFADDSGWEQTHHKVFVSTPNRTDVFTSASGGGDAGAIASAWETELNATLGSTVFGNKLGRAITDIDRDAIPEILVEAGDAVTIRAASGGSGAVTFSSVPNDLAACDLRYGELGDVDGDGRPDVIVRAHGAASGCPSEDESFWIRNLGVGPWFDSSDRRDLYLPVELGTATGWSTALAACPAGAVVPPLDYNPDWSIEGYLADQTRFIDVNDDGNIDAAVATYACWHIESDRWRPVLASAYSRIAYGNGKGGFTDSGLSAGPPVLLDPLDWGASTTDDTRISAGTLSAIDFDRDGRSELLQSTYGSPDRMGYGWASCASLAPGAGFGVSATALLASNEISMPGMAWDCNEFAHTTAFGDFDGDGFIDLVGAQGQPGYWWAGVSYSSRSNSENRIVETDNEHGGRTAMTWGFSAVAPNNNPDLPINVEVLQSVNGPGGARMISYHDGAMRGDRLMPFAEVSVTNDRGGTEVYSFTITSWGGSKPQNLGVRYRENGTVEHVTVLVSGEYYPGIGFYVDTSPPFFNALVRRCEFDIGNFAADLDALEDRCRELAWLASAVPQTGGVPDTSIHANEQNWDLLLGRRRRATTNAERTLMPKLWRQRGGLSGAPRLANATSTTLSNTISTVLDHHGTLTTANDYFRWPIPFSLVGKLPDVEGQEAAYEYPNIVMIGQPPGYAWDYGYDHPIHKLVTRYEHRDLSTQDDDRVITYVSSRPSAPAVGILGDWWRVTRETTSDRFGTRLTETERSTFSGFDSPGIVKVCGRTTPADCATDRYTYFSNGTLERHTFPDSTFESWTRLAWCGEPLTYRNPAGDITTYTRDTGGDAKCLTKAIQQNGATWTYTHDDHLRPKKLVISPGAGTAGASITKTYYYDDALTYHATASAREDWNYTEPRRAERRSDRQLELVYTDGLGRETKRVRCQDAGTNSTGGDTSMVSCSGATRVLAWNVYGADGHLKVTMTPFETGETPTTTGHGHDGQGRRILVMEPVHAPATIGWRTDTVHYGAGFVERREPTSTGTLVSRRTRSTLQESLNVGGVARGSSRRGLLGQIVSITATDGSITKLEYDGKLQLSREIRVDAAGQPVQETVVLPDGTTALRPYDHTILARDARGRVIEEQLADDTVVGYAYDALDRITRREVNGVLTRSYTYTSATAAAKATVRVVDELGGSVATSQLDGLGRVWLETAPRFSNSATYDTTGRLVSTTDIDNLRTSYYYDIQDDLTSIVDPGSGTTLFERDGAGRPTRRSDADGVVDTYSYTYSGLPYQHHRGPYLVAQHTYDPQGQITAAIENGVATAMTYDSLGRVTKRREGVDGTTELRVTTFFYDAGDRVIETRRTPVAGLQTASTFTNYDAWGRAFQQIDALGNVTLFRFDAAGRVRRVRDPEGAIVETTYDELGRVTDVEVPGRGTQHMRYFGRQTYLGEPNLWRVDEYDDEDAARGVVSQRYVDGSGNLLAQVHPDRTYTRYTRPTGRILKEELFDAAGAPYRSTTHKFDVVTGHRIATIHGAYGLSYEYTAAGRLARTNTPDDRLERHYEHGLLARTVEAGASHRFVRNGQHGWIVGEEVQVGTGAARFAEIWRDRLGRTTRVQWTNGSSPQTTQTFSLFDYYGNPWFEMNQWGVNGAFTVVEASRFDALGRPTERATSGAGLPGQTMQWRWFANSVLAGVTTPAGHVVDYEYGTSFDHQLDRVTLDGTTIANVDQRDLRGAITMLSLPTAAQVRTTAYDDAGRPELRTTGPSLPTIDFSWSATYNPDSTLASEVVDDVAGANGWANEYTYDAAGRLVREVVGKTETTIAYTLDAAGNRTATAVTPSGGATATTTAQYSGPKLLNVGGTALTYNAWNEVTTDHHGNNYTRAADGSLTALSRVGTATAFARNARGEPVAALEPGLITRRTTWGLSAEGLPLEVDEGDGTVLTYVQVEGHHLATAVNGVVTAVVADPRSSPLRVGTTALGAATAFGVGATPPVGSDERFVFAMLERVPTAHEIMLARHRTYDPTIGRFLEPDPIGSSGGPELYQYAHNDPVNFVDPLGHAEIGTVCSTSGGGAISVPKIDPVIPTTLDSGIQGSIFDEHDARRALAAAYANHPMSGFKISDLEPGYPPDFPAPQGPMCVVNCMAKMPTNGERKPTDTTKPTNGGGSGSGPGTGTSPPPSQPPPAPPSGPEAPPPPQTGSPFAALGDAVKNFIDNLFGSRGGDGMQGESGADRLRNTAGKMIRTVHQSTPGSRAREAIGREALDRGADWVRGLADAPSAISEGVQQLGTNFRNDPVGTTWALGRDVAVDMVVGSVRDVIEGAGEYGSGLRDAPSAAYRMYTADTDEEARDAASDLLDAGGRLASGTYKLTGPAATALGVGVAGRGARSAARAARKARTPRAEPVRTPAPPAGPYATVHYYRRPNGRPHFSIEVDGVHSHLFAPETQSHTLVKRYEPNDVNGLVRVRTLHVSLTDQAGASRIQDNHLETGDLGKLDYARTSCATHVCDVLRGGGARGAPLPEGAGRYLRELFGIRDGT